MSDLVKTLIEGAAARPLDEILGSFREEGYARLGPCVDQETITALRARAEALMLGEIVIPGLFFQLDTTTGRYEDLEVKKGYQGPSLNYRKLEKLERDPLFLALINSELFLRVARALIDGPLVLYRAILMNKAARGGTELPWHQDGGRLWGLSTDPFLQIWTALDDAPEDAGCVEVVPRSHRWGLATPLGGLVPKALVSERGADRASIKLPVRAGEVLLIHNYVWHRSMANQSSSPRRAFSVCYMSASTRCLRKKGTPRSFPGVG